MGNSTSFIFFPDEVELKEYGAERRERSLPRHFGEKLIVHLPCGFGR